MEQFQTMYLLRLVQNILKNLISDMVLMENAFYNKENLNPQMKEEDEGSSAITVPDRVDAELLMEVLGNPEMVALLNSLAKTMR